MPSPPWLVRFYDGKSSNGDITDVLDETLNQVGIGDRSPPRMCPFPPIWRVTQERELLAVRQRLRDHGDRCRCVLAGYCFKAYATEYANGQLKGGRRGARHLKVEIAGTSADAQAIYEWLSDYTRYDNNTFPYSNAIAQRLDYTSARVAAQQDAKGRPGEIHSVRRHPDLGPGGYKDRRSRHRSGRRDRVQ